MTMPQKKKAAHSRRTKTDRSNFAVALQHLKRLKYPERREAIRLANNAFLQQFCNHLKKLRHAKVKAGTKKVLKQHKKQLRQLLSKKGNMSKRRYLLSQDGGGILRTLLRYIPIVGPIVDLIDRS